MADTPFEGWAIVELMGHRRLAGYVTEVELAGAGMLRLDVPGFIHTETTGEQEERGQATQFYSAAALYCLTPTTEEMARRIAELSRPQPVHPWELRPAITTGAGRDVFDDIDEPTERECRQCGCTDDNACEGGCHWVEDDLCSACAVGAQALEEPQALEETGS